MQGKRVYRSRTDRIVAGVAGGLAAYFNIDPLLVRIGLVLFTLINGAGILLYITLWALLPNEDSIAVDTRSQVHENVNEMRQEIEELVERVRGMFQR